jgi:hypothetical protein
MPRCSLFETEAARPGRRHLTMLRLSLCVGLLATALLLGAGQASGWSSSPQGAGGLSTHEWVIHEANRISVAQGFEWADMAVAQPASDEPDTLSGDTVHHFYDVWGAAPYGDAPTMVATLYQEAVSELRAGDKAGASRTVGLLSHYYADICEPLHTGQGPQALSLIPGFEGGVQALTDVPGKNRAWITFDGYQQVWDPAYKAERTAEKAHADYATLVQEFGANGYDPAVETIGRRALNLAVNGMADVLISIYKDARSAATTHTFDATQAMAHIHKLSVDIGVRVGGAENEAAAARYARAYLKSLGYTVDTIPVPLPNGRISHDIRAIKKGTSASTILVGGHIDSVSPSPGANDNGSGAATVLELARDLNGASTATTIEFVLFGTEELIDSNPTHDHFGSRAFVSGMSATERANLVGMISVDMIADGSTFTVGTMNRGPRQLCDMLLAYSSGHGLPASYQRDLGRYGWSDHAPFELAGYPVAWMEWGQDPAYHTARDTYAHLQPTLVQRTGTMLLGFLAGLGPSDLARLRAAKG